MKTISITIVVVIIMIAAAYSAERPVREELKFRARYVMPGSENREPQRVSLSNVAFPATVTEASVGADLEPSAATAMFRDPQEITEEGLSPKAFQIRFPEQVIGDPSDITMPENNRSDRFRKPAAITEEGLTEKVFQIAYPAPVIGSPSDIQAHELKSLPARG